MMKELEMIDHLVHAVPCSLKLTNGVLSSFQQGIVFHKDARGVSKVKLVVEFSFAESYNDLVALRRRTIMARR